MTPVVGGGAPGSGGGPGEPTKPSRSLSEWRRLLSDNRLLQMSRLRAYAEAGAFPLYIGPDNAAHVVHRELTSREPVFVDYRGVHCAVGYLMDQSGWAREVSAIVAANNNVYVEEIEDGPLVRWVEISGLTQEEAAFIQPSYDWERPGRPRPRPVDPEPEPEPDPSPDHIAAETERLRAHFADVDTQLREDFEMSIDEALYRLRQRLEAGQPLGRA